MNKKIKVLGISGSTRGHSSNTILLKSIAIMFADHLELKLYRELEKLPNFNPDNDLAPGAAPEQVEHFRRAVREADAVMICTPEYAIGIPGALKNAIDWTVSSMEFSNKPVALITASLAGARAHNSLLGTLLILESRMKADTQLLISGIRGKMDVDGTITNENTLQSVNTLVIALVNLVNGDLAHLLKPPPMQQDVELYVR